MGWFDDPNSMFSSIMGPISQALAQALPQSTYDPNRSFAQNALDPRGIENAMNMALGFSGGGLATRNTGTMLDRIKALSADRLAAEAGDRAAGSPARSFSAIAADQPQGIRAYHGSPYDFNAFDASKIGTGEGAQAYGHGLYFAENPQVAEGYRFAGQSPWAGAGPAGIAQKAQTVANAKGLSGDEAKRFALDWLNTQANALPTSARQPVYDALNNFDTLMRDKPGKMYEVNINAEPHQFLDWDKPLSEQSQQVREALQSHPAIAQSIEKQSAILGDKARDPTGQGAYAALTGWRRGVDLSPPGDAAAQAIDYLRGAGIPGIRYLDQGSRGAGQGTSNYVLFDPSIVDILKKYGLAGLGIGGGAAAFPGSLAPQQF